MGTNASVEPRAEAEVAAEHELKGEWRWLKVGEPIGACWWPGGAMYLAHRDPTAETKLARSYLTPVDAEAAVWMALDIRNGANKVTYSATQPTTWSRVHHE